MPRIEFQNPWIQDSRLKIPGAKTEQCATSCLRRVTEGENTITCCASSFGACFPSALSLTKTSPTHVTHVPRTVFPANVVSGIVFRPPGRSQGNSDTRMSNTTRSQTQKDRWCRWRGWDGSKQPWTCQPGGDWGNSLFPCSMCRGRPASKAALLTSHQTIQPGGDSMRMRQKC